MNPPEDSTTWMPPYKSFEQVFWEVCTEDFPGHIDQLRQAASGIEIIDDGNPRSTTRICEQLMEQVRPPWPRYDRFLAYRELPDPRIETEDEYASHYEAGELLAHRITMTFYTQRQKSQFLVQVDTRPYWSLSKDDACPGCASDPDVPLHWQDAYWQRKQIPCEWLGCRSSIRTFTKGIPA